MPWNSLLDNLGPAGRWIFARLLSLLAGVGAVVAAEPPPPTFANVGYGPSPYQLVDIYVPTTGEGPFPVVMWYGGIWKPSKHPVRLDYFLPAGCAVVAVETRTMNDGLADKVAAPVSYVMDDACRAVQFVRLNAVRWKLDPARIAVGGGSQGALPALYVGCSADRANPQASDPVERQSTGVRCVAAYRCQPTIDPRRMQEWVPGVKWGAPALGCTFEESLARREELLPVLRAWSPDWLLHKGAAPIYFENEWGLTKPADIGQNNYDVHSPAWAIGFEKLARQAGTECHVKYPEHPTEGYDHIWDFVAKRLKSPAGIGG